jgi:hypothetical protein
MISCSLSKFFYLNPKARFMPVKPPVHLTLRGEDEAGSDVYLDIVTTAVEALVEPLPFRRST